MENISPQIILNIAFATVSFFSGWMLKVIFGLINRVQEEGRTAADKAQDDYRRLAEQITGIAIALPERYVSKDDFNNLVKAVHHRFDRLEEKIDSLKKD